MLRKLAVIRSGAASIGPPDGPREKRPTGRARRGRTPRWHRSCVASGAAQAVRAAVAPMPRLRSRQSLVGSCALGRGPPAFCQSVSPRPRRRSGDVREEIAGLHPRPDAERNHLDQPHGACVGVDGPERVVPVVRPPGGSRLTVRKDVRDRGALPRLSCGSRAWRLVGRGPAGSECPSLGSSPGSETGSRSAMSRRSAWPVILRLRRGPGPRESATTPL
jgi:hypothetical protein